MQSHSANIFRVSAWPQGELDYSKLAGDTGPLVYPAGFVYLYSWLRTVTREQVLPAQVWNMVFGKIQTQHTSMVVVVFRNKLLAGAPGTGVEHTVQLCSDWQYHAKEPLPCGGVLRLQHSSKVRGV